MEEAVIVAAVRSPMGRAIKGQFAQTRIDDLAADVIKGALAKVPSLNPSEIEDALIGCAMPEGEQGLNVARNIVLLAGLPLTCAAATINRFCGSSLETINMAAEKVCSGNGEIFLAGGIESMSHVPMGGFNPSLNEKLLDAKWPQAYIGMGTTAENLAKKYQISRQQQDAFAAASHQKAIAAMKAGKFREEIIPVTAIGKEGIGEVVSVDEGPREDTSVEKLATLKPAFLKNGTVTAGNSSPLTDGAAMVIVMAASKAKSNGIQPLARIRGMAVSGCAPETMGEGPILAVPKALKRAGCGLQDIDLIELNEAFAAQSLSVIRQLKMDEGRVNSHGGAIALGHPLGCSGARLTATLVHALRQNGKSLGLVTLCIGGGQGIATVIEMI